MNIDICINDDYACLDTDNYSFYFGYEFDTKICACGDEQEVWGFEVKRNSLPVFRISYDKMEQIKGCPEACECDKCLLFGIGLFLEKENENE